MSARDANITISNQTNDALEYHSSTISSGKISSYATTIPAKGTGAIKIGSVSSVGGNVTLVYFSKKKSRYYKFHFDHPFGKGQSSYSVDLMPNGVTCPNNNQHPKGHDQTLTLNLTGNENNPPAPNEMEARVQAMFTYNDKGGDAYKYHDTSIDADYRIWKPSVLGGIEGSTKTWNIKAKFDHIRTAALDDHCVMHITVDQQTAQLMDVDYHFEYSGYDPIDVNIPVDATTPPKAALAKAAVDVGQAILGKLGKHDKGGRLGFPAVVEAQTEAILALVYQMSNG